MTTDDEALAAVERLARTLTAQATGGLPDPNDYAALRRWLLREPDLAELAPSWLRSVRTLAEWWAFIKPKFPSYAERTSFVATEFDPLITYLEDFPSGSSLIASRPPRQIARRAPPAPPLPPPTGLSLFDAFFNSPSQTAAAAPTQTTPPARARAAADPTVAPPARVFLVHGRDHSVRDAVARCLERLGLEVLVLEELSNQGRTIIEKFETHAEGVVFAVVVMTPDDMGGPKGGRSQPRARQNVVLELGFFIGLLGRRRVAAIIDGQLERPSDIEGVLYIPFDPGGGWQSRLAKELKSAGLDVDLNRLA